MRRAFLLFLSLLSCCWMSVWGQGATVTITADHNEVCAGETVHLNATMEVSDPIMVDFETGNFSQAAFNPSGQYPWEISTSNPHQGTYCMRSTNYHIHSSSSAIQVTVTVPHDGLMSFWVKVSSEKSWDKFYFYIDGIQKGSALSGNIQYTYMEFAVSEGVHTYKWEYTKDTYSSSYDDRVYVDDITLFREYTPASNTLSYDFESHSLEGWTTIDADGDGFKWMLGTELMYNTTLGVYGFTGHNSSSEIVVSQSFESYGSGTGQGVPLFPDNYLVAPCKMAVTQGASIEFYACAQDDNYASEHFGVAISTQTNDNPGFFTTIQQWTMTAKSDGQPEDLSPSGNRTMGNWHKYTVNLDAYVGQYIWVAIRHFNVSDMFYLDVDDITLKSGNSNTSGNVIFHWEPVNQDGLSITVNPTQTTTYMVGAYMYGFSAGIAKKTIVVNQPDLTIIKDPDEDAYCEGDEITLSVEATVENAGIISPGDILCTDNTIVRRDEWPVAGKTAKAIVFYVDNTDEHGWAVALTHTEVGNQPNIKWSTQTVNVSGLTNCINWIDGLSDIDGKYNTQKIRNAGNSTKYPAAWSVNWSAGWYLPAEGQLNVLFGEIMVVNSSLSLVGGETLPTTGTRTDLWSSTQSTAEKAMFMRYGPDNIGLVGFDSKSLSKPVRQIIDFDL